MNNAGMMGGCKITIENTTKDRTEATISVYPVLKKVSVDRVKDSVEDLMKKVLDAFYECYANKDVQY